MPHSSPNVTSASGESLCTTEPLGKQSSDAEEAVLSVASKDSLSSKWRTCPGMLGVLLPATRMSPTVVALRAELAMLSRTGDPGPGSPAADEDLVELAGRTECRRTPNLSFHPPTLPLARWIKKEDALEALAKEGTRLRLSDLPSVGSPSLGDEEHSQYFLPLPLPLPLNGLPSPLPPFGGPQVFEDEADGFEKQLSLLWPGFWQKLQLCSRGQSLLLHPFGVLY